MAEPQSATGPSVLIVVGIVLMVLVNGVIGVFVGGFIVFVGMVLLFVRMGAGVVNTAKETMAEKEKTKSCPYCAELIKKEAIVCRYCGRNLANQSGVPETEENVSIPNDQELMEKYKITLSNDKYQYGEYRYDKLNDAVKYARTRKQE